MHRTVLGRPGPAFLFSVLCAALLSLLCEKDRVRPDTIPPAAVSDLRAIVRADTSITLTWTAPGDDGSVGTAASYDLRYASEPLTLESWNLSTAVSPMIDPASGGLVQSQPAPALHPLTHYFFALRAVDEAGNWSGLSNQVSLRTPAAAGVCSLSVAEMDFGRIELQQSTSRSFRIFNIGGRSLEGAVAGGTDEFRIESGSGPFALQYGESLEVNVEFQPQVAGPRECTFAVDLPTGGRTVHCTGYGLGPLCEITEADHDFGTVAIGTSATWSFSVSNSGGGTLTGNVQASCTEYTLSQGVGAFALGPGESRLVVIAYSPTVEAEAACTVDLGAPGCTTVGLRGRGLGPVCRIEPDTVGFGEVPVGEHAEFPVLIANDGGGSLNLSVPLRCGAFDVVSGGGDFVLAAGQSRPLQVRFTPAETGTYSCTLDPGTPCGTLFFVGSAVGGP